jgi:hypothetical protein
MPDNDIVRSTCNRRVVPLLAALGLALSGSTAAGEQAYGLGGLFCNTEEQIDEALGYISRSVAPRAAAELTNDEEIACTYVDLLHYIVEQPLIIGEIPGEFPMVKHEAKLVGVVVGGRIRPVSPPARIFFVTQERLPGAVVARRA